MERIIRTNQVFLYTIITIIFAGIVQLGQLSSNGAILTLISQVILALPSVLFLYNEQHIMKLRREVLKEQGTGRSISTVLCLNKIRPGNIILLVLLTYSVMPVISMINAFSQLVTKASIKETMQQISYKNPFAISLFCIAIVPAILEELVYRGVFYQEYRKVKPRSAILLSSFLFAILHLNIEQFIYAFIMGILFSLVIEATDSLYSTIIMHFVFNANSVILLYMVPEILENTETLPMGVREIFASYGFAALIGGVVAFAIYRQIAKNCGRLDRVTDLLQGKRIEQEKMHRPRLVTPSLAIAIGICIVIITLNEIAAWG